ncbi:MAG: hypothetical protein R3F11_06475 [Verrucomicrobiales bacterium]
MAYSDAGGVYLLGAGGGAAQRLMETPAPVTALAFRPDGKLIAAGLSNGQLACAHLPSGQRWLKQAHDALVSAVLFSPDGALLATVPGPRRTAWHHGASATRFAQRSAIAMALGSGTGDVFSRRTRRRVFGMSRRPPGMCRSISPTGRRRDLHRQDGSARPPRGDQSRGGLVWDHGDRRLRSPARRGRWRAASPPAAPISSARAAAA